MLKIIPFILVALFISNAKAQDIKTYSGKEFDLKVYTEKWLTDTSVCKVDSIVVIVKVSHKNIQTIKPPKNGSSSNDPVMIEDMNFDNHEDIRITQWPGMSYTPCFCWVFDPKSKIFTRNDALEKIQSPQFDQKKKRITSFWREGAGDLGCTIYKDVDGKLVVTKTK